MNETPTLEDQHQIYLESFGHYDCDQDGYTEREWLRAGGTLSVPPEYQKLPMTYEDFLNFVTENQQDVGRIIALVDTGRPTVSNFDL